MENTKQFKVDIAGTDLVIETGLLAQQAAGAVTVSYGDTTVFTAVTNTDTPREGSARCSPTATTTTCR